MDIDSDILGSIGAFLTTIAFLPQAIKVVFTKETKSISLLMFLLMNIGNLFWLLYGISIKSQPIIWANSITLGLSFTIFYFKLKNVIVNKEGL